MESREMKRPIFVTASYLARVSGWEMIATVQLERIAAYAKKRLLGSFRFDLRRPWSISIHPSSLRAQKIF
jgi:hypothetical protein